MWDFQKEIQAKLIAGKVDDTLLMVEHDPVYTLGKNANENHLLQSHDQSVDVFNIDRGGDITLPVVLKYSDVPYERFEKNIATLGL